MQFFLHSKKHDVKFIFNVNLVLTTSELLDLLVFAHVEDWRRSKKPMSLNFLVRIWEIPKLLLIFHCSIFFDSTKINYANYYTFSFVFRSSFSRNKFSPFHNKNDLFSLPLDSIRHFISSATVIKINCSRFHLDNAAGWRPTIAIGPKISQVLNMTQVFWYE